ncbi:MAG: biotin synthase BioB [Peptococcaceae bacterium]|jgi:biotin synthase|nr:biotin synthase BioB [Peptococcaceae bacterium]
MINLENLINDLCDGRQLAKEELLELADFDTTILQQVADALRQRLKGANFEFCSIINGKSGKCSEDCKYCAQSVHYPTAVSCHGLLHKEEILNFGQQQEASGITRFSVVTSGKALTDEEIDQLCEIYKEMSQTLHIQCCASHGLLSRGQLQKLKAAGVTRYHNNLETSRRFFPQICTTHTYDDKIAVIRNAKEVGLSVCSGGIIGLGETMEDRIDMALQLRELAVDSTPINVFHPIAGTPLGELPILEEEEVCRTVALFRLALPAADIRLAGGRGQLADNGRAPFLSGANAAITGDMLTTAGPSITTDKEMLGEMGFTFSC